jgi:hypothetical protein
MKAFSEKSDFILRTLLSKKSLDWEEFTKLTNIEKGDALLTHLKDIKNLIDYNDESVFLTQLGEAFISITSFTSQRDKQNSSLAD